MCLVKPLSRDKGSGRYTMYLPFHPKESVGRKGQIHCVFARPLVPREGLYQIRGQSLNTHRGRHRSGGAQFAIFRSFFPIFGGGALEGEFCKFSLYFSGFSISGGFSLVL